MLGTSRHLHALNSSPCIFFSGVVTPHRWSNAFNASSALLCMKNAMFSSLTKNGPAVISSILFLKKTSCSCAVEAISIVRLAWRMRGATLYTLKRRMYFNNNHINARYVFHSAMAGLNIVSQRDFSSSHLRAIDAFVDRMQYDFYVRAAAIAVEPIESIDLVKLCTKWKMRRRLPFEYASFVSFRAYRAVPWPLQWCDAVGVEELRPIDGYNNRSLQGRGGRNGVF